MSTVLQATVKARDEEIVELEAQIAVLTASLHRRPLV